MEPPVLWFYGTVITALKVVTEEEFNAHMQSPNTAGEIRERYQRMKGSFQITVCKTCGTTRTASSWDEKDVASMVHELGADYKQLYLAGYRLPNLSIHATLSSFILFTDPTQSDTLTRARNFSTAGSQ
jgi:hypothetical protein